MTHRAPATPLVQAELGNTFPVASRHSRRVDEHPLTVTKLAASAITIVAGTAVDFFIFKNPRIVYGIDGARLRSVAQKVLIRLF